MKTKHLQMAALACFAGISAHAVASGADVKASPGLCLQTAYVGDAKALQLRKVYGNADGMLIRFDKTHAHQTEPDVHPMNPESHVQRVDPPFASYWGYFISPPSKEVVIRRDDESIAVYVDTRPCS